MPEGSTGSVGRPGGLVRRLVSAFEIRATLSCAIRLPLAIVQFRDTTSPKEQTLLDGGGLVRRVSAFEINHSSQVSST